METLICKECGKEFTYNKMSTCKAQLKSHINAIHKMSLVNYITKYEYGGVRPLCPCGCGRELGLRGSGDRWKFNTYYSDTCYGRLVKNNNDELEKHINRTKRDFDIVRYYEENYDRDTFTKAYDMLKTKQYSLTDVSKSFKIDKRTLKKVWLAMNVCTPQELTDLLDFTKYKLSGINYPSNIDDKDGMLSWMYNMAKSHPGKYTVRSIIEEYNKDNKDHPCYSYDGTIARALHRVYGDEIDIIFAIGYHSSEEYDLFKVLKFYFPDYSCRLGKRFVLDGRYVYYDIMIGTKLLIEYDSVGKFHKEERSLKNDKEKELFAKENGYEFLRLNLDDAKNINMLFKIKSILENETN